MNRTEKAAHHDRVELLKDLFTLIYPDLTTKRYNGAKNLKEKNNEERKTRIQKWFSDIEHAVAQEESPWGEQGNHHSMSLLPQFMQLLRECVLTHQWTQVLAMLDCVSHIPYGADWTIWKATLTALYNEPEENLSLIQDFFKQSYLLRECNVRDIALEFVQCLISQGRLPEASQAIHNARKVKKGVLHLKQGGFTRHLIDLLDAYQGLIFYVEWKAALCKKSESSQNTLSESFYDLTSGQGLSDDSVKSIAQRALLGLDRLQHIRGVWDIFLTKSVEIHEYYEEFEEARELLHAYRERNPDNPNSHRFLHELLERNSEHFDEASTWEESLSCLKSVAKADPANPLVLTLCQKLSDGGDTTLALRYAFDLLDNIVWQDRAEGWQCFVHFLTTCLSREKTSMEKEDSQKELERCWSTRQDWWPSYHFDHRLLNSSAVTSSSTSPPELLFAKCIAASVLVGKDCIYVQMARQEMDKSSLQHLQDTLSNIDWAVVKSFTDLSNSATQRTSPQKLKSRQPGTVDPLSHFDDGKNISDASPPRHSSLELSEEEPGSDDVSVASSSQSVQWIKRHKQIGKPVTAGESGTGGPDSVQDLDVQDRVLAGGVVRTSRPTEVSESESGGESDGVGSNRMEGRKGRSAASTFAGGDEKYGSEDEEEEEPYFSPLKRRKMKH